MNFLAGADPELFVMDINSERFISAIGKFGGTKQYPKSIGQGCSIQEDNVALEFNIPPASSKEEFIKSINYSLDELATRAHALDLKLSFAASADFDKQELNNNRARQFGCDRDYNAWTEEFNPTPNPNTVFRCCGGHVHIGFDMKKFSPFPVARVCDLTLGVASVILDPDKERRKMYGRAGACRIKEYGVEYRALSNFWLKSDHLKGWVYDQIEKALSFLEFGNELTVQDGVDIQQCINTYDVPLAHKLLERYSIGLGTSNA